MSIKSRPCNRTDAYIPALYEHIFNRISIHLPSKRSVLIEIGAGTGLGKQFLDDMIVTDIEFHRALDLTCRSEHLPFRDDSVDALVLKDALHHIPDVEAFLDEATRVLKVGGVAVIFDPYWGALARFVYRFLHQEEFNQRTQSWSFESFSPWDSNQALSYILLRRDRERFVRRFPQLIPTELEVLIGPSFLLSGGVSRRTRISGRILRRLLEWEMRRSSWLNPLRFFHIFSLTKQQVGQAA